jgi:glyoxylase-like metal-dependent hydrolase (beta-lactamase superfamily II)
MFPSFHCLAVRKWRLLQRGLLIALACAGPAFLDAEAAAQQLKTQAPGFYRLMLGDSEITALSDGIFELNTKEMLTNTTPKSGELLAHSSQGSTLPTSVNAYLVNMGDRLVLVDAGAAQLFGPTLGKLLVNLAAAGYQPAQVGSVLITHVHPNHIGGLVAGGKMAFPNATVYADQRDAHFWLSSAKLQNARAA